MISLNKAVFLTQGNPVRLGSLLSSFAPDSSSFVAVTEPTEGKSPFFSQISHQAGGRSAHFSFITPDELDSDDSLAALIDFMCYQAGDMGALNVLADVEEAHPLFERFRNAGFCAYGWESIWRIPADLSTNQSRSRWLKPSPVDDNIIRTLYQTLVPPLVQNAEPFVASGMPRLVYKTEDELVAYVESTSGSAGIYLVLVIHPSVKEIRALLLDLIDQFHGMGRPVYIQVRSYQAWIADHLQELGAEAAPRFSLLVKHLAVSQLNAIKEAQRSRSDQRQAEPTAPIFNHIANTKTRSDGLK